MSLKTKRALEWIAFSSLGLVLVITGSLFFYQNSYTGKIYKNVTIAGIDVSGKTKKQAAALVEKKFDVVLAQDISFKAGDKAVTAKVADTGIGFDTVESINRAYAVGRAKNFLPQLYASAQTAIKPIKLSVAVKIDPTKLNLFIAEKIPGLNVEPVNAAINIVDGQVAISEEQSGQQVNTSNLSADLARLVSNESKTLIINLQAVSLDPEITSISLKALQSEAEKLIQTKIVMSYEDKAYAPTPAEISAWIKVVKSENGKQEISLDDNAIKAYLSKIAKNFEIQKKERKINATNNEVLQEGQQGKYLDKDKALKDIKASFSNLNPITLTTYLEDPNEVRVFPAEGIVPDKYPGKYIDVDITQQRLCRIENNQVIDCFIISSGKASTPTPLGTRYVDSKETKRWSSPYGLWMPYWQSLGGGYGIHELPEWPNGYKEGESHLGTPVSHGCVRLGTGPAQTVFEWTEVGTPVYIHK